MDIYLSVNNRADILKIPVLPSQFTISKPQSTETFETVSHGELMLIGSPKLKSISISSFFPIRDYPYLRDKSMKGWEYVYKIDTWIDLKLPIRLIITETPINMAVAVKDFKYTIKTDGDLWYTLDLEEFNLLNYEDQSNAEDEIDMEELNKLKEQVTYLVGLVETLANPMIYNYIDENGEKTVISHAVETKVSVNPMSTEEIQKYIESKEPMDKAGAYGIQGRFSAFIEKIEGDYFNVVGLPVSYVYQVLKELGEV